MVKDRRFGSDYFLYNKRYNHHFPDNLGWKLLNARVLHLRDFSLHTMAFQVHKQL